MVVKKQLKKISKKIMILGLATSIIFTSCFSTKKIEVKAASIVATLSAWTLYDICLYVGGIAISALGLGALYENRDSIAQFGKAFIDDMGSTYEDSWMLGCYTDNGSVVYGPEVFEAVGDLAWDFIKEGGLTPSTATDLNGDGYVDVSDKDFELANANFWTTSNGAEYLKNQIQILYNDYVTSGMESSLQSYINLSHQIHSYNDFVFTGATKDDLRFIYDYKICGHDVRIVAKDKIYIKYLTTKNYWSFYESSGKGGSIYIDGVFFSDFDNLVGDAAHEVLPFSMYQLNVDAITGSPWIAYNSDEVDIVHAKMSSFDLTEGLRNCIFNEPVSTTDWSSEIEQMTTILNDISISLRSLDDVIAMCSAITNTVVDMTDSMDIISDLVAEVVGTYNPVIDVVIPTPIPWNPDITRPITATDLPRDVVIDTDTLMPDGPTTDDNEEQEIDLDGLTSIFNIIFYLIMIIVMLIYLFLSCLAFIVMIFRIPASSTMLPEEMVMGFDHLKTIMIPGMNISIYGFAMALIYMFIIFAVIKLIRLEINDFKFPRSYK